MKRTGRQQGFTLVEMMVVVAVVAIMAVVIMPSVFYSLPKYRLKRATRDFVNHMHKARMNAIRDNRPWRIDINEAGNTYTIRDSGPDKDLGTGDDIVKTTVDLTLYGSGVRFGWGNAGTTNWDNDPINQRNFVSINARGFMGLGSTYLTNSDNTICFAVTTNITGVVKVRGWNGIGQWDD